MCDTNPAIWLTKLNIIRQSLIDDYELTTDEDADILQHIMYESKPAMNDVILGIKKACLVHETIRHATDYTYKITLTLYTVQEEF
jgi:hypothetical protein